MYSIFMSYCIIMLVKLVNDEHANINLMLSEKQIFLLIGFNEKSICGSLGVESEEEALKCPSN